MSKRNKGVIVQPQNTIAYDVPDEAIGNFNPEQLEKLYLVADAILGEAFEIRTIAATEAMNTAPTETERESIAKQIKLEGETYRIIRAAFRQHKKERAALEDLKFEVSSLRTQMDELELQIQADGRYDE